MKWIITEDTGADPQSDKSRIGFGNMRLWAAVRSMHAESRQKIVADFVQANWNVLQCEFRLLDDDGNVDYAGRCGDVAEFDEGRAFAPLDWAACDTGSTRMQFRKIGPDGKGHGKWEDL